MLHPAPVSALLVAVLGFSRANPTRFNSCGYPNNTATAPHTYSCNTEAAIQVLNTQILDQNTKKPVYPIDPSKAIIIDLTAVNHGVAINDDKANVRLFEYSTDFMTGDCGWQEINIFGLLDNIDGCQMAHNCPLQPGNLSLELPIDLSKYAAIIQFLTSGNAYQLQIEMFDYNQGSKHELISCAVSQVKFA
ncbi:hypothetical protein L596_015343 [Steinernema carpocapsae]|uniref:MD-2-related lipid-recognition domain-containing protein n=1 Tax=Steinernema carpocapsae TaxID=34508 RepID=A0A4U5NFP9_STECR|nr:hypothetical protein L596_015343 [Steinernema carpocapsae]